MTEKGFAKSDLERVGIFQEMEYITVKDPYRRPGHQFNEAASKGKQMLPGGSKERSAQQHGYFNDKFGRVFEGESYSDPIKRRRQARNEESKKNIGSRTFMPSNGSKSMNGLGSLSGTFGGVVPHLEPVPRASGETKKPGRNFITNPLKKGTGFGYLRVTLGDYPKYQSEPYERNKELNRQENERHKAKLKGPAFRLNLHPKAYFTSNPFGSDKPLPPAKPTPKANPAETPFKPTSPAKKPAGMKAGTFDPYPSHSVDPYIARRPHPPNVTNKFGKTFYPSQGPKSRPQLSVIDHNVIRSINRQNYKTIKSVTT